MIEKIKALVLQTAQVLQEQHLRLTTAESCTGGGLSYWLTSIPGSSDWFECAYVTYSNEAKMNMLEVSSLTLQQYGAVSKETACEMAEFALQKSGADISIAITGIAGPAGGSEQKPVGTVWLAWAKRDRATQSEVHLFPGDRQQIRLASIATALEKLLEILK